MYFYDGGAHTPHLKRSAILSPLYLAGVYLDMVRLGHAHRRKKTKAGGRKFRRNMKKHGKKAMLPSFFKQQGKLIFSCWALLSYQSTCS